MSISDDDTPVTVCLTHLRFVPCRSDGEHCLSTEPIDVAAISSYQQGELSEAEVPLFAESLRQMRRGEGEDLY